MDCANYINFNTNNTNISKVKNKNLMDINSLK